jgi:hypothetical protein
MIATAQGVSVPTNRDRGINMGQTYKTGDKVVVVSGPDAERQATVQGNYDDVYGDDLTDGAVVRFDDNKPSKDPVAGQMGVAREFRSSNLRRA